MKYLNQSYCYSRSPAEREFMHQGFEYSVLGNKHSEEQNHKSLTSHGISIFRFDTSCKKAAFYVASAVLLLVIFELIMNCFYSKK